MTYRVSQEQNHSSHEELHRYLHDLATMPVLTFKAEQEVLQRIALAPHSPEADAARTLLIEANLSLVVCLARRYQPLGGELFDLIQEGNLALTQAAHQFDPQRRVHFKAFATQQISWALYYLVEDHERHRVKFDMEPIHPLRMQTLKAFARTVINEQVATFNHPEERFFLLTALLEETDTDTALTFPDEHASLHTIGSSQTTSDKLMPAQKRSTELAICLQTLTTRERLMLIHRYVLNIAHLLEEVVRTLDVHRARGGQLEPQGRQKIRHNNLQNFNSLHAHPSLVFPERETERKD